jgi:predicted dehydrogenase/threonine dehydrogenase-like Zn-dependent dehydrogenase
MHQVVQDRGKGALRVMDIPVPMASPGHVVILNRASLVSAGTERMARDLAQKSLLAKAKERPDQVRRVLEKVRQEGLLSTARQVQRTLQESMPLGYSSAGIVAACGAGVEGIRPGDRVASNGPHAGAVSIPRNLCAAVPEGVADEHAAFATLGAIALQGVRLSETSLGETVLVVGLGIVGQLTVALLRAAGVRVLATDLQDGRCDVARAMGASGAKAGLSAEDVAAHTRGLGADAVIITAATASDRPVELAAAAVRMKGRVIVVGAVGMQLPRRIFYEKEAELVVSRSYGPGRYDPAYEERGNDYPPAYVRWTEQRNLQAVLELMAAGQIDVGRLITHRFPVERADEAYDLVQTESEPYLGVILQYADESVSFLERRVELRTAPVTSGLGIGFLGAGNFAGGVLLPEIERWKGKLRARAVCSAKGLTAVDKGRRFGFEIATTDPEEVLADPEVDVVFVATRHEHHADQVVRAIRAGKHVFVEKPLALTVEELHEVERALESAGGSPLLMVGFNRRFAPASETVRDLFAGREAPLAVSIRFNAGSLAADHWTHDEVVGGGRIVGEACHGIDLATYLTGSPPVRVFCEAVGGPSAPAITQDRCFITLRHADGSISSIAYLAGGDKAFPKERVEVIGDEKVAVIEDFREVMTVVRGRMSRKRSLQQDKGHRAEVGRFLDAVASGAASPIGWEDLRSVSLASILAVRSLREGVPFEIPGVVVP